MSFVGNRPASGTAIIDDLGPEHLRTGRPILYTSADSVLQIAAHEEHFGLERLFEMCEHAYELVKPYNIGRVIARPFVGIASAGNDSAPCNTTLDFQADICREAPSAAQLANIDALAFPDQDPVQGAKGAVSRYWRSQS